MFTPASKRWLEKACRTYADEPLRNWARTPLGDTGLHRLRAGLGGVVAGKEPGRGLACCQYVAAAQQRRRENEIAVTAAFALWMRTPSSLSISVTWQVTSLGNAQLPHRGRQWTGF